MTLRLTPTYSAGKWAGHWTITGDDGTPIGDVYRSRQVTFPAVGALPAEAPTYAASAADIHLSGPTLARTMTALAAVLEHAAGYVVVDEPHHPGVLVPSSRVIRADEQAPIRVDEDTSTPVTGVPIRPTVALHIDQLTRQPHPAT